MAFVTQSMRDRRMKRIEVGVADLLASQHLDSQIKGISDHLSVAPCPYLKPRLLDGRECQARVHRSNLSDLLGKGVASRRSATVPAAMSVYDERLRELREQAKDAQNAVADLPSDAWSDHHERSRLQGVLAYAQTVLEATDPTLVSDSASVSIRDAFLQITNDASSIPANAAAWGGTVLDALARLPIARGREMEEAVKDAAAAFQRSAQARLGRLTTEFKQAQTELTNLESLVETQRTELTETLDQRKAEIAESIEPLRADFEQRLAQIEEQARGEQTALSELRTSQTSTFEEAEQHRASTVRDHLEEADAALREHQERVERELEEHVAEIRRMEEQSAQLVGAIGLAGTAERYGEEARAQKLVADMWRYATVVLALLAVGGVLLAIKEKHPVAETFSGKLALSLILGGIATYAARQSTYHRHREQRARDLQLELTAFSPFIEPLSSEQQEEERVIMTRKTFGKTSAISGPEDEPGPHFLSLALRRRKEREAEEETAA